MYEIERHSSLMFEEYVRIVATWHHDTNKKQYDCKNQIAKMSLRKDAATRIEGHKNRNGCNKIQDKPRQTKGVINFHNCYCNHIDDGLDHLLFLQEQFSKGILPNAGSLAEQPNKAIEVFKVIERLKLEREIAQQKEANKNVR